MNPIDPQDEQAGEIFQRDTRYSRGRIPRRRIDWSALPKTYKQYPSAPVVSLEPPQTKGGGALWDTLRRRRSLRDFGAGSMTGGELSQLLWACQGITLTVENHHLRTAPSAGALYPVETYLTVNRVRGISPGIYHYAVRSHSLELLKSGDFRDAAARAALDQEVAARCNVLFVWTAVFERCVWKYGQRAYRYVYLDAGHVAQNLALAATAMGLGSCPVAAFYDDEVNALLSCDQGTEGASGQIDGAHESAIYMTAVGRIN